MDLRARLPKYVFDIDEQELVSKSRRKTRQLVELRFFQLGTLSTYNSSGVPTQSQTVFVSLIQENAAPFQIVGEEMNKIEAECCHCRAFYLSITRTFTIIEEMMISLMNQFWNFKHAQTFWSNPQHLAGPGYTLTLSSLDVPFCTFTILREIHVNRTQSSLTSLPRLIE